MKRHGSNPLNPVGARSAAWRVGAWVLLCGMLTGCGTLLPHHTTPGPDYQPDNTCSAGPGLPWEVRRVVMLPLMADQRSITLVEGRNTLDPVLHAELTKTKKFEVIRVTPEDAKSLTGQPGWTGEEALPPRFFASLRRGYECDAVLFCQLTVFRAYPPLAVGWRLKLVDARSGETLWAGDEVFDSGQPAVLKGARQYQLEQQRSSSSGDDPWVIENSPRHFGEYAAARLLATMPER